MKNRNAGLGTVRPLAILLLLAASATAQTTPLVYNGTFEILTPKGQPDGWYASGYRDVIQELTTDADPAGNRCARLVCTRYVPGTPSSHAMLCQLRRTALNKGAWYRLTFRARGEIEAGHVRVSIQETRGWKNAGLLESFQPATAWKDFSMTFQAFIDVPQPESRLAFYFLSPGRLWIDDVVLEPIAAQERQWFPQITVENGANAVPNSSFECGTAGWGSLSRGRNYNWMAGLFDLAGQCDTSTAFDGERSLKTSFAPGEPLLLHTSYPDPEAVRVPDNLVGHQGWFMVTPGKSYVFSAYVRADRADTPVRVTILQTEGGGGNPRIEKIGTGWTRVEYSFVARRPFVAGLVGMSFEGGREPEGTLWIDAVQFEAGTKATPYRPREELEAGLETGRPGNIFIEPGQGMTFSLLAWNAGTVSRTLRGRLTVTDFRDHTAWQEEVRLNLAPKSRLRQVYRNILAGQRGFFRLKWEPETGRSQNLRSAVIDPVEPGETAFGFNHAFPVDFLFPLSSAAGLRWWRDWSVSWQNLQPEPGSFDFSRTDSHLGRILELGGKPVILFPFPSSTWSAGIDPEQLKILRERRTAGLLSELGFEQAISAFKPVKIEGFEAYVTASVSRYHDRIKHFEVLNEPLYTRYALPAGSGYGMADYLEMLKSAYRSTKAVDPGCTVIGGIAGWPGSDYAASFIEAGGLQWCDVMNWHLYPGRDRAESLEEAFKMRWDRMRERREAKPIWVTEFGIYAEDDPPYTPFRIGDPTMTGAMRPDELTAASELVQLVAMMCANGVRKVFYHAGTCQGMNTSSSGNIFFEYGGAPRKMYAAQAVLSRLLGPDLEFVRRWDKPEWLAAYQFRSRGREITIFWTRRPDAPAVEVPEGFQALDLMGNPLPGRQVTPTEIPVYLIR